MTLQLRTEVRNAMLQAIEDQLLLGGTTIKLEIRSGSIPANCAAATTGTLLANVPLPTNPFAAASGGSMSKTGTWEDTSADGTGTATYFRIFDQSGNCIMQGSVTATGGGGDLTVDNTSFAATQAFTITSFTLTQAGA